MVLFYLIECQKLQEKIPKGQKVIRNLNFDNLENMQGLM